MLAAWRDSVVSETGGFASKCDRRRAPVTSSHIFGAGPAGAPATLSAMATRTSPLILVVDDDPDLRALLETYLDRQGFAVRTLPDARELDRRIERERPDLVVLDLMLPGEDGLSVCRRLRANHEPIPIIMLTARSDDIDRILGLEMGADDYLGKPFNPRELVARIQAVLRRFTQLPPGSPQGDSAPVSFGHCTLDLASRVLWRDGERVTLTSGEFSLLAVLVQHPHRPLSRDRLIDLARGRDASTFDRSMDVQISRLRKLVEPEPASPRYIQTVWGHGYVFVPDGATHK